LPIPAHFEPLSTSPFSERIGPLYIRHIDGALGVRIAPYHANRRGRAHGGLLMTVADVALSRAVAQRLPPGSSLATADLHIAFLDGLGEDDWLEAIPSVDRIGRSLIHGSCVLRGAGRDVARVLATFAVRLALPESS
jgi:acyl-coenzyme A thioesterase 13